MVRQAKSKQKIIDKMEAAGLVEKIETSKALRSVVILFSALPFDLIMFSRFRFNFEDVRKLPPPIIAFNAVAFSYSGKKEDYLYKNLSFGIE